MTVGQVEYIGLEPHKSGVYSIGKLEERKVGKKTVLYSQCYVGETVGYNQDGPTINSPRGYVLIAGYKASEPYETKDGVSAIKVVPIPYEKQGKVF